MQLTWTTTQSKLKTLQEFYWNTTLKEMMITCPFGKSPSKIGVETMCTQCCAELCGNFKELGAIPNGCPCETLGRETALLQLGNLLRSKGLL